MNKYTLYIGLNDKDTKCQQLDNLEASKIDISNNTYAAASASAPPPDNKRKNKRSPISYHK